MQRGGHTIEILKRLNQVLFHKNVVLLNKCKVFCKWGSNLTSVDSRQISPKVSLMLRMQDLVSLARLAGLNSGKVWVYLWKKLVLKIGKCVVVTNRCALHSFFSFWSPCPFYNNQHNASTELSLVTIHHFNCSKIELSRNWIISDTFFCKWILF